MIDTLQELKTPVPIRCHFVGDPLERGPLPTLIYFSLSSEESLNLPPFNSLALSAFHSDLRIFSFSIPFHDPPDSKFEAMKRWSEEMKKGSSFLEDYFDQLQKSVDWLIQEKIILPHKLALAGLSRGAFIATHLAKREKRVSAVLGLAPLTDLSYLEDFREHLADPTFASKLEKLKLHSLVDELTHLHQLRFYIGNRDEKVSTDLAYSFIRQMAEKAHEKKARHMDVELFIRNSIGHKGHGTSPETFFEGGKWLQNLLLKV